MTQTERLHFLLTELTQEDPVYEGRPASILSGGAKAAASFSDERASSKAGYERVPGSAGRLSHRGTGEKRRDFPLLPLSH